MFAASLLALADVGSFGASEGTTTPLTGLDRNYAELVHLTKPYPDADAGSTGTPGCRDRWVKMAYGFGDGGVGNEISQWLMALACAATNQWAGVELAEDGKFELPKILDGGLRPGAKVPLDFSRKPIPPSLWKVKQNCSSAACPPENNADFHSSYFYRAGNLGDAKFREHEHFYSLLKAVAVAASLRLKPNALQRSSWEIEKQRNISSDPTVDCPRAIHVRAGDIFTSQSAENYAQPPLSFYLWVIDHMRKQVSGLQHIWIQRAHTLIRSLQIHADY
jgi:hypothetical protein